MNSLFQTDNQRVQMYLTENAGWLKIIVTHTKEIPVMKKLLTMSKLGEEGPAQQLFNRDFSLQQVEMAALNSALVQQQKRLKKDTSNQQLYDIDSLCSQDILRDRIKDAERKYIELKCSYMKYLASTL